MRLQHPKEDSHMTRIIFTMAAAVAVLTAFAIATPADAQNCRIVTTTVQTDDGRVFGRRERRCDIARRPNCRILTMTVHTDDGRMFARRERRCS
jgi:transketolase C-terminal domain/subunit